MTICYFGNYNPEEGRNRIFLRGLKEKGVKVIECRTTRTGLAKYFDLAIQHWRLPPYDYLIVGYPGHILVPLAKLLSRRKVIFDALCTMWEGVMISRQKYSRFSPAAWRIWLIDWLAVRLADLILVETTAQCRFFVKRFRFASHKVKRVFTGADDAIFRPDPKIKKSEIFTVVFRGKFLPEAGVPHLIKAAKLLEGEEINFLILGLGYLEAQIKELVGRLKPARLTLINRHLPAEELRDRMLACHLSVGQLENHDRLSRTIPHKAFESLALGLPYVTARTVGVAELLTEGETCLMVNPADPEDLAEKILQIKLSSVLQQKLSNQGRSLFLERLRPAILAEEILSLMADL